eukprot:29095_1
MGNQLVNLNNGYESIAKQARYKPFKEQHICSCYINHFERHQHVDSHLTIPKIILQLITCFYPDDRWKTFKMNDIVDCKTKWQEWYPARIISRAAWDKSITVQFIGFESKWNETIHTNSRNYNPNNVICECKDICRKASHKIAPLHTQSLWNRYSQNVRTYDYNTNYNLRSTYSIDTKYVSLLKTIDDNMYKKTKTDENRNLSNITSVLQCISATIKAVEDVSTVITHAKPNAINYALRTIMNDMSNENYKLISIKPFTDMLARYNIYYWKNKHFLNLIFSNLYQNLNSFHAMKQLFEVELKYDVICNVCENAKQFKIEKYCGLDVPINVANNMRSHQHYAQTKTSDHIIDIHRLNEKPIRHVFKNMSGGQKIKTIAKQIKQTYATQKHYLLFYEVANHEILNGFPQKRKLKSLPDTKINRGGNIGCFVVKNWNNEVSKEDTEQYAIESKLIKFKNVDGEKDALFGFPFIICYLSTQTNKQIHQLVYSKLFVLCEKNSELFGNVEDVPQTVSWLENEFKEHEEDERAWDKIFDDSRHIPYKLLLLPDKTVLKYDSQRFDDGVTYDTDIRIIIKWKSDKTEIVQNIFKNDNNIQMSEEYLLSVIQENEHKEASNTKCDTVHDCIKDYLAERNAWQRRQYWYCEHCRINRAVLQSRLEVSIHHLPRVLVVKLQRFGDGYKNYNKINKVIQFDVNGFNMSKYTERKAQDLYDGDDEYCYDLYAVICHENNGEYFFCFILNEEENEWYLFNYYGDVIKANVSQFEASSTPYILFYKQRSTNIC